MATDRVLTPLELRASEAVIVAEKLALMLEIIQLDAAKHADLVLARAGDLFLQDGWAEAMTIATNAIDLAAKIRAYHEEMQPLVDDLSGKEALAQKERIAPTMN